MEVGNIGGWRAALGMQMTDRLGIIEKERDCHTANKDKHWKYRKSKEGRVEEEGLLDTKCTLVCFIGEFQVYYLIFNI